MPLTGATLFFAIVPREEIMISSSHVDRNT